MTSKLEQLRAMPAQDMTTQGTGAQDPRYLAWLASRQRQAPTPVPGKRQLTEAQRINLTAQNKARDARQEANKQLRSIGHTSHYLTKGDAMRLVDTAVDEAMRDDRRTGRQILRDQHGTNKGNILATRHSRYFREAMQTAMQRGHAVLAVMAGQDQMTSRDISTMSKATAAGFVAELYKRADNAGHRTRQDAELAELRAEVARLKAGQERTNTRLELIESGQAGDAWKAQAMAMRAAGDSYAVIAKATGQTRDAVAGYIRRQAKVDSFSP
ncbi:hypothetical protein FRT60_18670 [Pseudomonas haemolytica]|uniref:Uncharacterized protein n=1 Tax=Pseudomonas haemolytica TaxID=2600065 RepID=A0A646P451_9PSED|nr:hypothetical protein [Pseudomonas haemolytica]MRJ22335.1 hypothetical protein [Pseudomonas haemolytica]